MAEAGEGMIELRDVDFWRKSVSAISSFISEGNFRFNDKGVFFKATDPSQIVLVDYFIDRKVFDKYEVEPTFVGVDVVELSKILDRALPGDRLLMDLSDAELLLTLEGQFSRAFRLPLIDVSDEEVKMPEHRYDAQVTLPAKMLREILKDATLFGSSVVLRVKNGAFLIEARGSHGALNTKSRESKKITVKAGKDVVSKYSLNFLMNIVKEAEPEAPVLLEFKTDAPARVSYDIGASKIQFYLAHMLL